MRRFGFLLALAVMAQPAQACPDPAAALDAALAATIAAVRGGDAQALLGRMSAEGVSFGPDAPPTPLAVLRAQFADRGGRYCDVFACNGVEGALHRRFVTGRTDKSVDARRGLALVFINANTDDELDLSYRLGAGCRWELNGIAAP